MTEANTTSSSTTTTTNHHHHHHHTTPEELEQDGVVLPDSLDPWNGLPDFACVDLNELWAAAIPLEDVMMDADDDVTVNSYSPHNHHHQQQQQQVSSLPTPASEASGELFDAEQGKEVVLASTAASPPGGDLEENKQHYNDIHDDDISLADVAHHHRPRPSRFQTMTQYFKYLYSGALLILCIVVVSAAIFKKQTTATGDKNVHPVIAFLVFWALIVWLAIMEGGLNSMVGLKPIDPRLYQHSHPKSYLCTKLAHRGDNLERFIVGRQFLDLTCVFLTSFMASSIEGATVLGLPEAANKALLGSGLAVMLVTIVIGQLVSVINAAHCMLDHINNYVMMASTYAALTIEGSGLLHAVYFIQIVAAKLAGRPIPSAERKKTVWQKVLFWGRVVMSLSILVFALVVTIVALYEGTTTMWSSVPPTASVFLLIFLIFVVGGLMESLQIALFAVVHLPQDELLRHPVAHHNCQLLFRGSNLQAFLIGRQILQTIVMFTIARITTLDVGEGDENIFGVSDGLQAVFNTGLLGALISTILASLCWRVLASTFPIAFLAFPLSNIVIRASLFVENTGICSISWILAAMNRKVVRYHPDEVYIGTVSERVAASAKQGQHQLQLAVEDCTSSDSSH